MFLHNLNDILTNMPTSGTKTGIIDNRKTKNASKRNNNLGQKNNRGQKSIDYVSWPRRISRRYLRLTAYLNIEEYAVIAPQATNNTWYPYSFLVPRNQNEPWLSSALDLITDLVVDINTAGIPDDHIYFLGFSQGACLTLEYVTRNATRWGGAVAFTGGLIGDKIYSEKYYGDFRGTPIFIGTSNPDPHVPVDRVKETTLVLKKMNAS